jgi:hypothetical protein
MEKHCEFLDREIDRINKRVIELENQNFALSKGLISNTTGAIPQDPEIAPYLTSVFQDQISSLKQENIKLTGSLTSMKNDFTSLLSEVERLRHAVVERDN